MKSQAFGLLRPDFRLNAVQHCFSHAIELHPMGAGAGPTAPPLIRVLTEAAQRERCKPYRALPGC